MLHVDNDGGGFDYSLITDEAQRIAIIEQTQRIYRFIVLFSHLTQRMDTAINRAEFLFSDPVLFMAWYDQAIAHHLVYLKIGGKR